MARPTLHDVFEKARAYLDTDALNFPDSLCDILMKRVWFQAASGMERGWRFQQQAGSVAVQAGTALVPFTFTVESRSVPAARIHTVRWIGTDLVWNEYTHALRQWGTQTGAPVAWSELNDGLSRQLRLFPIPGVDGVLYVDFYLTPTYPTTPTETFADLPEQVDDALLEGLLAEMYMREEDPDLYQVHRQIFLEAMGAIRNNERISLTTPLVMAGRARAPGRDPGGFAANGAFTDPNRS
jgi:hypothetical protein